MRNLVIVLAIVALMWFVDAFPALWAGFVFAGVFAGLFIVGRKLWKL